MKYQVISLDQLTEKVQKAFASDYPDAVAQLLTVKSEFFLNDWQSTDRQWEDGAPVMKEFERNGNNSNERFIPGDQIIVVKATGSRGMMLYVTRVITDYVITKWLAMSPSYVNKFTSFSTMSEVYSDLKSVTE